MTDLFEADVATTTTSLDLRRLQRQKRRATRRKWALVLISVGLVIAAMGGSVAYNFVKTTFHKEDTGIADYEGLGQGNVQVIVQPGDNGQMIAETLYSADVVASVEAFVQAYNDSPDSRSIKPGYYYIHRQMSAQNALLVLLDPNNRDLRKVTLIEGKTLPFYFEKIAALTGATVDEVKAAAEDTDKLGLPAEAEGDLEGWLFPATYEFNPGVTPTAVMQEMVAKTISVLDSEGVAPADREKILTIASIVEREAKLQDDRPKIAGVIYNRLDAGWALGMDSTIKYVLNDSEELLTADELETDSPYNTYTHTGLPPGPIAGAGAASIDAAVNPAQHDYMYFTTINLQTGETRYARTTQEHTQNKLLLQQWIDSQKGKAE